jgi:hypothetical protein
MDGEQMIAENALLLVTEPVGFENLLSALEARYDEGHGCVLLEGRVEWAVT